MITTVTACWQREEVLRRWVQAVKGASRPGVKHLVYLVGEPLPAWWAMEVPPSMTGIVRPESPGHSIGYYHNLGAQTAATPWIMKLDVDAFPHVDYFEALLPNLAQARPQQWFNGGMFYLSKFYSSCILSPGCLPLSWQNYLLVMENRRTYSALPYLLPAATNFICRRQDYINLGGCDSRFRGYGWEDYQQIYILERTQRGQDPLAGPLDLSNVTRRCRDEISRPKARELWEQNPRLCLFHSWHPPSADPSYRASSVANRQVLLSYITACKKGVLPPILTQER